MRRCNRGSAGAVSTSSASSLIALVREAQRGSRLRTLAPRPRLVMGTSLARPVEAPCALADVSAAAGQPDDPIGPLDSRVLHPDRLSSTVSELLVRRPCGMMLVAFPGRSAGSSGSTRSSTRSTHRSKPARGRRPVSAWSARRGSARAEFMVHRSPSWSIVIASTRRRVAGSQLGCEPAAPSSAGVVAVTTARARRCPQHPAVEVGHPPYLSRIPCRNVNGHRIDGEVAADQVALRSCRRLPRPLAAAPRRTRRNGRWSPRSRHEARPR